MANPVVDNPKLAAALGRATSLWAHAELHLGTIFAVMTGLDLPMAVTVFSFFKSVRTQNDVLLAVAKASALIPAAQIPRLNAILIAYGDLATERNSIAHNPLGYDTKIEGAIYRMAREPVSRPGAFPYSTKPLTIEEVDALTEKISQLTDSIIDLSQDLVRPHGPLSRALTGIPARLPPETRPSKPPAPRLPKQKSKPKPQPRS